MKSSPNSHQRAGAALPARLRSPALLSALLAAMPLPGWTQDASLAPVTVKAARNPRQPFDAASVQAETLQAGRASSSDTASLLRGVPGVSLNGAGGVSSLPSLHGLSDDRLRIQVDGMDLVASCPNHMNPPLSYLDPTNVGTLKVYAGITPVSVGGDSIGGTIVAETAAPQFAPDGQALLTTGELGAHYRSNNQAVGANVAATLASDRFSLNYTGATAKADNYKAGGNFKATGATGRPGHELPLDEVGSTAYETRNHTLNLALRGDGHLVEARLGYQDVPYQLYPNQRMDMLANEQQRIGLRYLGQFDWGALEARAYHEKVSHYMDFGPDKQLLYGGLPGMPMRTEGRTTGATLKATIDLTGQDLLRVGGEFQRYRLDDWWPPVAGSMGMGPNTFLNINNGKRDRTAVFGEWEKRLGPQWLTLVGARHERVSANADPVHGYNQDTFPSAAPATDRMNQGRDAASFNNANRGSTDKNWDLTALARYTASPNHDVELGVARKVRSPNLYERYTWSSANMMAVMNNFAGDGNGYIGNVNLKPETAHTLSATFDWHAADRGWELKATPYYTRVADYIDAVQWNGAANAPAAALVANKFVALRYANQSARIYGLDLSGHASLARNSLGEWGLKGLLNYTSGKNRDTGDVLYNMMPLEARLMLTHRLGAWDSGVELVMARAKNRTNDVRNEIRTPGYGLVNLHTSYTWRKLRLDFGIENLFDKFYRLPLGGAYIGQGTTMGINSVPWGIAVPGMGRSVNVGATMKF
jgi:iron complex outermembrane receptor protein